MTEIVDSSHAAERIQERLEAAEAEGWYGMDEQARADVRWLLVALRQAEADRDDRAKRAYEKGVAYGEAERVRLETALREARKHLKSIPRDFLAPAEVVRAVQVLDAALSAGEVPGSTGASRVMRDVCSCGAQFDSTCTCQPGSTGGGSD